MKKKRNILLIMTDEQRADAVGYANAEVFTPNIDSLAAEAIVYTNGYACNPSCIPSRAAMFTGRYPSQCGAPCYITPLNDHEVTFMARLQDAGYYTAAIGKEHLWKTKVRRGYDYEDIIDYHCPPAIISPEVNPADFGLPGNNTVMEHASSYVKFLYDSGFRRGDELFEYIGRGDIFRWKADEKYYVDAFVGDQGLRWLDTRRDSQQPWFLHLSFPGPHMPFDGFGLQDEAHYREDALSVPETSMDDLLNKPPHYEFMMQKYAEYNEETQTYQNRLTPDELRRLKLAYYANMTLIDRKIGQIIDKLKEMGEYDNTAILYTSDHGDFMGDYQIATKAQYLSEALLRVPLLAKPAEADFHGHREDAPVCNINIPATCLAAAGIEIPDNMQKENLLEPLTGTERLLYAEARNLRSLRDDRYKIIYYANRPYGELYDLLNDPNERRNLWKDSEHRDIKDKLIHKLLDKIIFLGENMSMPWNVNDWDI